MRSYQKYHAFSATYSKFIHLGLMDMSSSIFSLMTLPEMNMRLFFRSFRFPLLATLYLWMFTCHTNNSLSELSSPARIDLEGRLCWCWQLGVYAKDWKVHGELVLMSKGSSSIIFFYKTISFNSINIKWCFLSRLRTRSSATNSTSAELTASWRRDFARCDKQFYCFSSPFFKSARAFTGRRCPHRWEGGRLFEPSAGFFYGNSCNSGTESRKIVSKVGN